MEKRIPQFVNRALFKFVLLLLVSEAVLLIHKHLYPIDLKIIGIIRFFISAAIVLIATNFILRLTVHKVFVIFENDLEIEQRIFISKLYAYFIYSVGISFLLYLVGFEIKDISLFIGLITTAIALAVRDLIMSFFVWLIVLNKRPFKIGDTITYGDDTGTVERIGTFFITISNQGQAIKLPNKVLLDRSIKNYGKGRIARDMRFALKSIPKKIDAFRVDGAELSFSLDSDGKDAYLVVTYSANLASEKDVRSDIIRKAYSRFKLKL
jgi:small-conductance mechanosensitive channel